MNARFVSAAKDCRALVGAELRILNSSYRTQDGLISGDKARDLIVMYETMIAEFDAALAEHTEAEKRTAKWHPLTGEAL